MQVVQPQIAKAFANGMEFFATYGGCTAAGAAGMATLKVIQEEKFQERAQRVGRYLTAELNKLKEVRACWHQLPCCWRRCSRPSLAIQLPLSCMAWPSPCSHPTNYLCNNFPPIVVSGSICMPSQFLQQPCS